MYFSAFLIFLISHCIFDFVFQSKNILKLRFPKDNYKMSIVKGNVIHSFLHLLGMYLLLWFFSLLVKKSIKDYIISIVVISICHFTIDLGKSLVVLKRPWLKNSKAIFILDQLFHILVISLCIPNINFESLTYKLCNYKTSIKYYDKFLMVILIILICTSVTGVFIKVFIGSLNDKKYKFIMKNDIYIPNNNKDDGAENGGFIIGILERFFIMLIICINQPTLIGFVLATKSVARFKKLENESFAEYFIIGTFISFTVAMIGGLFIRKLIFYNN